MRSSIGGKAIGPALREEGGLPASPHANHGESLPSDPGKADVSPGQGGRRGRQGFVELEAKEVSGKRHCAEDIMRDSCHSASDKFGEDACEGTEMPLRVTGSP